MTIFGYELILRKKTKRNYRLEQWDAWEAQKDQMRDRRLLSGALGNLLNGGTICKPLKTGIEKHWEENQ